MRKNRTRWQWLLGGLLLVTAAAGCFQSAGTGVEFQSEQVNPGATFTSVPSNTPLPQPSNTPALQPTQSVNVIQQQVVNPTFTLPFSDTVPTQNVASVQQALVPTNTLDPIDVTAAYILQKATDEIITQVFLTQAAAGLITAVPSITPFGQQPPVDFATTQAPVFGQDCIYEVRAGDRLFRIALTYGVTVEDIVARTGGITNPNILSIGQKLVIPGCGTTGAYPPPTSTATQSSVFGSTPATTFATPVPSFGGTTYVVRQGDTLFQLSLQFGVPIASIMAANPTITDMNAIFISQEIVIPAQ